MAVRQEEVDERPVQWRVPNGALLRSGLSAIKDLGLDVPPGKTLQVGIAATHEDGRTDIEVGYAWLIGEKWRVEHNVNVALANGQRPRVSTVLVVTR